MNSKLIAATLLVSIVICTAYSQKNARTENDKYVFWHPGVQLHYYDYQGATDPELLKEDELLELVQEEEISFLIALDSPNDESNRGRLKEKLYIVPVFNKKVAYNLSNDSLILKVDQLRFDAAELSVRLSKEKLMKQSNISPNAYGYLSVLLPNTIYAITQVASKSRMVLNESAFAPRHIKEDFESTRKRIDSLLEITKKYATTPEDCKRFLTGKPLSDDYRETSMTFDINKVQAIIQD